MTAVRKAVSHPPRLRKSLEAATHLSAPMWHGVKGRPRRVPDVNESHRQPAPRLSGSLGMEPVTEELLGRMVRLIVDEVDPEKVILFGSRGRGDATPESDVDLVVIEASPFDETRSRLREEARLYRVLAGVRVRKDILVYSAEDVEYWRESLNYVLARALREGRVLYERP